jgi:hypothetical protein
MIFSYLKVEIGGFTSYLSFSSGSFRFASSASSYSRLILSHILELCEWRTEAAGVSALIPRYSLTALIFNAASSCMLFFPDCIKLLAVD